MALGGSGDRAYLPVLRRVAAEDAHPQARALAYNGIMYTLGPDSLEDLRLGAKDPDEQVRATAVVDSYNLLELGHPEPRLASCLKRSHRRSPRVPYRDAT
jgi:hypothetical protein